MVGDDGSGGGGDGSRGGTRTACLEGGGGSRFNLAVSRSSAVTCGAVLFPRLRSALSLEPMVPLGAPQ